MAANNGTVQGVTQLIDNGSAQERWNIVFLGDGFTALELTTYNNAVDDFILLFRNTPPFDFFWSLINIFRINVISDQSGADIPAKFNNGVDLQVDTYFDATFGANDVERALVVDNDLALDVAFNLVPEMRVCIVLVNSSKHGGTGGTVGTFSLTPDSSYIAIHEIGHTFFGLADEYAYKYSCKEDLKLDTDADDTNDVKNNVYEGGEPSEPNVTKQSVLAKVKWRRLNTPPYPILLNPDDTKCPPSSSIYPVDSVGLFEGAKYFHTKIFRPSFNCMMKEYKEPFCKVCVEVVAQKLAPFSNYIANKNTQEIHQSDCRWVKKMLSKNMKLYDVIDTAILEGYNGCYYCLRQYNSD
jgi:hypothetical protein